MANTKYISDKVDFDQVLSLYQSGWSSPRICAYLAQEVGVSISPPTILRIIRDKGGIIRQRGWATAFYMGTNRNMRNRSAYSAYYRLVKRGKSPKEAMADVSKAHNISASTLRSVLKDAQYGNDQ